MPFTTHSEMAVGMTVMALIQNGMCVISDG
jgi:hypothetical protein